LVQKPRASRSSDHPEQRGAALPLDAQARRVARATLAIGLVLLSLWIALDFLAPLAWSVVIALTVWPAYRWFAAAVFSRRSTVLAPLSFTLIVGVVLFVPVALALQQAAQESQSIINSLAQFRREGIPVPAWLTSLPFGEQGARWWSANLSDPNVAVEWLGGKDDKEGDAQWTRALGSQLLHRLFLFFIALLGVFVLLRDGAWIGNRVLDTADRLLGDPGERLASRMVETVRGTVNGTVVVAVAEGIIIGAAYIVAGVPNPLLFMLLTMTFAMVPLGAWVVFSTAALMLVLQGGSALAALGVFGFGAIVMIIGDTAVWPALVGNQARLPFLLALIGIFGGVQAFGLIGLFVGPMILASLWIIWREWLIPADAKRTG
jgi:predicted PurR-regulated permease PerM